MEQKHANVVRKALAGLKDGDSLPYSVIVDSDEVVLHAEAGAPIDTVDKANQRLSVKAKLMPPASARALVYTGVVTREDEALCFRVKGGKKAQVSKALEAVEDEVGLEDYEVLGEREASREADAFDPAALHGLTKRILKRMGRTGAAHAFWFLREPVEGEKPRALLVVQRKSMEQRGVKSPRRLKRTELTMLLDKQDHPGLDPKIKLVIGQVRHNGEEYVFEVARGIGLTRKMEQILPKMKIIPGRNFSITAWRPRKGEEEEESGTEEAQALQAMLESWREAIEEVDRQVSALQKALKATKDAELIQIADFGLNALTGDFRTPLQAALLDAQRASGEDRTKALEKAATIADQFLDYLDEEEIVKVVDGNPFDVKMSVRKTLGAALERITEAM